MFKKWDYWHLKLLQSKTHKTILQIKKDFRNTLNKVHICETKPARNTEPHIEKWNHETSNYKLL